MISKCEKISHCYRNHSGGSPHSCLDKYTKNNNVSHGQECREKRNSDTIRLDIN